MQSAAGTNPSTSCVGALCTPERSVRHIQRTGTSEDARRPRRRPRRRLPVKRSCNSSTSEAVDGCGDDPKVVVVAGWVTPMGSLVMTIRTPATTGMTAAVAVPTTTSTHVRSGHRVAAHLEQDALVADLLTRINPQNLDHVDVRLSAPKSLEVEVSDLAWLDLARLG